jgi:hypothetical protein
MMALRRFFIQVRRKEKAAGNCAGNITNSRLCAPGSRVQPLNLLSAEKIN